MAYGALLGQRNGVQTVNNKEPNIEGNVDITATDVEALSTVGGTMTGNINMNSNKVTGLPTPTANTDAASKAYVDRAKNYIVAEGTSGPWNYYRKWNNGIAECWATKNYASVAVTIPNGSLYESEDFGAFPYPFNFAEVIYSNATSHSSPGGNFLISYGYGVGAELTNCGIYTFVRPTPFTIQNVKIQYYTIGRWK